MTCKGVSSSLKSILNLVSQVVLEELTFQRYVTTQPRLRGGTLATNDDLNPDKEGERIKIRVPT